MPVLIALLRGVNLGPHKRMKMDALRGVFESLGFTDVRTYLQSGNVVFRTKERNVQQLAKRIEDSIEQSFGFRSEVVLRTPGQLKEAIACCPFAARPGMEPNKLLITFLKDEPSAEA